MLLVGYIRNNGVNCQCKIAAFCALNLSGFLIDDFGNDGTQHVVLFLSAARMLVRLNDI